MTHSGMAKRENVKLGQKLQDLKKGRLLWVQLYAPWSSESESWRAALRADPRFPELARECVFWEVPVEEWIDWAQGLQAYLQYQTGHSGWPLNVFLNKEGRAVFLCGALETGAMITCAAQLLQAYAVDPRSLDAEAQRKFQDFCENDPQNVSKARTLSSEEEAQTLNEKTLSRLLTPLEQSMDLESGLIGGDFVFHFPSILRAVTLWQGGQEWSEKFLVKLARSPLYDVVGGGFFRSLNRKSSKTSTEKLLVENVELLDVLLEFLSKHKQPFLEEIAAETLDLIRKNFRSPGGYYSALSASSDYYEWESRDLFSALGSDERGVAQKFFGVSAVRKTVPFLATEVSSLSKDWSLEPLDLRLKLLDVRRKLQSYVQKNRHLARPRELPPQNFATALAVATLARAAFTWDIPELLEDGRRILKETKPDEMGVRDRWAWARAHLAVARAEAQQGSPKEAIPLITWVEDELLMESDFQKCTTVESPVFGKRLDLADHLGPSAAALYLQVLMDLKALQKMGLAGKRGLPLDEMQALASAVHQSRTLGINAGGVYATLARFLRNIA